MDIWVFLVILIVVIYLSFLLKKKYNNPAAAGMNFDLENIRPFLKRSSHVFNSGFTEEDINLIESKVNEMSTDHGKNDIGIFHLTYNNKKVTVRVEAEIHVEGDSREVVLLMYSEPMIVKRLDEEMMKFVDEMGM